eukprot:superscaffoldBa00000600_g5968
MFVLWKIELKYKECRIAHSNDGQSEDSCNDGKSLQNTPTIYLHIPNFSNDDVGTYQCETVYTGGADAHMINVDIIADSHFTLICILTVVISIAVLAGILFLAQKKLTILRCSKQADTSPSKPLPTAEDVEEVEPYASYVQRVNSIYNS